MASHTVYKPSEKYKSLQDWLRQCAPDFYGSQEKLARFLKVDRSVVRQFLDEGKITETNRITLARAFLFDPQDFRFIDPLTSEKEKFAAASSYCGRDTSSAFNELISDSARAFIKATEEARLQICLRPLSPISTVADNKLKFCLNNVSAYCDDISPSTLWLEFEIRPFHVSEFVCGFKSVEIDVDLSSAPNSIARKRLAEGNVQSIQGAIIELLGTAFSPSWQISSSSGILSGTYYPKSALFELASARAGGSITACLQVSRIFSELTTENGNPLPNPAKHKIIKRMILKEIEESLTQQKEFYPDRTFTLVEQKIVIEG